MIRKSVTGAAALAYATAAAACGQVDAVAPLAPQWSPPPASVAASAPPTPLSSSPSLSSQPTVHSRPTRLPRNPTDTIKKTTWVVGTITVGGDGPCYTLVTDDGTQYALHAVDGRTLTRGSRMRVNTAPASSSVNCGPGRLVEMVAAAPLG